MSSTKIQDEIEREIQTLISRHTENVKKANTETNECIDLLDEIIEERLKKQEEEYLKGYSIYVKNKEKELRELIYKLHEKNSNSTLKDEIIFNLKQQIRKINEDQIKMENQKQK